MLRDGPRVLMKLVEEVGGKKEASRIACIARVTLNGWLDPTPRKTAKVYQTLWSGYPAPFPGLDRVTEEVVDPDLSFLGFVAAEHGWQGLISRVRTDPAGFGLSLLGRPRSEIVRVCQGLGLPPSTYGRWWDGLSYPKTWRAMDRLAHALYPGQGATFLQLVLDHDPLPRKRRIAPGALGVLYRHVQ